MPLIVAIEVLFLAGCLALFGVAVAFAMRSQLVSAELKLRNRERALKEFRSKFYALKEQFTALQAEHDQLKADMEMLQPKANYVEKVLADMGDENILPAAQSARLVLQSIVKGMSEKIAAGKTARLLISVLSGARIDDPVKVVRGSQGDIKALTR